MKLTGPQIKLLKKLSARNMPMDEAHPRTMGSLQLRGMLKLRVRQHGVHSGIDERFGEEPYLQITEAGREALANT